MCSDWEDEQEIVTSAQTACERACLRPAWRGRRHFHKADCLPILSLFNKARVWEKNLDRIQVKFRYKI